MNHSRSSRMRLLGTVAAGSLAFGGMAVGFAGSAGASRVPGRVLPAAVDGITPATSITLWTDTSTGENWQQPLVAGFTKATGISVSYDGFPQTTMQAKITAAQETKSTDFQIYDEPESLTPNYVQLNGVMPINSFKTNTTLTPASYDAAGIPPGATSQCTLGGEQYCYPTDVDPGPELFYNISMLRAAHLTPPASWSQVLTDATKLTTKQHAGICIRGSETAPNGYPVLLMLPYFLPYAANYKGEYLNANWKPLFDTPQALTWAKEYATLMQKDNPAGVSSYGFAQCEQAFDAGQVAMWWDDSTLAPNLYLKSMDPQNYRNLGVDEIHCPSFNQSCLLEAPWGMFINKNDTPAQAVAAYEFMEYMTSPSIQIEALNESKNPSVGSRPATLAYAIAHASRYGAPVSFLQAVQYAGGHVEPNAIPETAAFGPIQNVLFVTLSELIAAQITPQQALQQLQSQMTQVLGTFHLPPS